MAEEKGFFHQFKSALASKLALAVSGLALVVVGVLSDYLKAHLEVFIGKPQVEIQQPIQPVQNQPIVSDKINIRSLVTNQFELQELDWKALFQQYKKSKLKVEDGMWLKAIPLPANAPIGTEFQIHRISKFGTKVFFNGNMIDLPLNKMHKFYKSNKGWILK